NRRRDRCVGLESMAAIGMTVIGAWAEPRSVIPGRPGGALGGRDYWVNPTRRNTACPGRILASEIRRTTMSELTLESLARRLEEVDRRLNQKEASSAKDWRMAAGMFTGREFSKIVDEKGRKIREADREEARQEFGA